MIRFARNNIRGYRTKIPIHGCKPAATHGLVAESTGTLKLEDCLKRSNLQRIIDAYRNTGFLYGDKDPLAILNRQLVDGRLPFEASGSLLDDMFNVEGLLNIAGKAELSFEEIQKYLHDSYCGSLTLEISHVQDENKRNWFYNTVEAKHELTLGEITKKEICEELIKAQVFENFLAKKFPTLKRYGGEGAESMLAFFHQLFSSSAKENVEDCLISIPHRGRLSLLTGMLNYEPALLFHKIKGNPEFASNYKFTGDVVSHLTSSTDLLLNDKSLHVTMIPNPSHLEASHPVVTGKTRSRQLTKGYGHYGDMDNINRVINIHVHGDAAVAGQGIVMETFAMSSLPHFDVGGTIHLIVNNQIGFTTPQRGARSSQHCSDVGKMTNCPIIHVNGDYPEEVARAAKMAFDYKCEFHEDVIVNMHCYRRWGHNELDDPTFTNPSMYKIIHERVSVPELYKNKLMKDNVITEEYMNDFETHYFEYLNQQLAQSDTFNEVWAPFKGNWKDLTQADYTSTTVWNTGCDVNVLKQVGEQSVNVPDAFGLHPHLKKILVQARQKKLVEGTNIDWATAEAMAIGTLLLEGQNVRICGQDVGRGTFSQRHAMVVDQNTEQIYIPLNHMKEDQKAFLEIGNSLLSEEAVLAFEYGMSIENPDNLCIWEAQFGDFFNGAQIIIDTFISNGELKWLLQSGLVLLLPHGMDGAGPDHSSCKIERFLQLCDSAEDRMDSDDVNMQIVNPTTPAQYFHLLRRQQIRNFRKPLIIASPKLILRMKAATSSLSEMDFGTYFQPILNDTCDPSKIKKVLFCSGKYYYELDKLRTTKQKENIAIIRLESLCPFPSEELKDELQKYSTANEFVWCQEEHRNQGAWSFVYPRFKNLLNVDLTYHGRDVLGASACGIGKVHNKEIEQMSNSLF